MKFQKMSNFDYLYIVSKVSPYFPCGLVSEEYLVSEDFFYPLFGHRREPDYLNSIITNNACDTQNMCDKYSYESERDELSIGDFPRELACLCVQNLEFMKFLNVIKGKMDAILFSMAMLELKRSKAFRKNVLLNFFKLYARKTTSGISSSLCITCDRRLVKIHANVFLKTPKKNILDHKGNRKIQILVNEKCELENAMAWLSTLGGAFSALGDTYIECAERAGAISLQQLYIALRLGDPLTICRCKIYLSMSFLQKGYIKKTKSMIRELYKFSTEGEGSKDFRLKNMCLAVWNRVRYVLSQKRIKKIKAQ